VEKVSTLDAKRGEKLQIGKGSMDTAFWKANRKDGSVQGLEVTLLLLRVCLATPNPL